MACGHAHIALQCQHMSKQKSKKVSVTRPRKTKATQEYDGVFLLKIVLYLILGSLWLKLSSGNGTLPLPLGLIVGILFAFHDHFQIDRKIEYAVLLVAMLIGYFAPFGLYISF